LLRLVKKLINKTLNACGWALWVSGDSLELRPLIRLGGDHLRDIRFILGSSIKTVFDVGANDGHTVLHFRRAFPEADIFSFEPDPATFQRLSAAARGLPGVQLFNVALGSELGEAQLFRFGFDETNSLLPKAAGAESYVPDADFLRQAGTVPVKVSTVDAVCETSGISRIDLLKMDTQGFELEVLRGAGRVLESKSVAAIYAEVSFVRYYENQPLFPEIYSFLYERGYRLVSIYESGFLTHYYQVGGNALFVHESVGQARPVQLRMKLGRLKVLW
jgi:FkbM family methyltransferase